MRVAYNKKSETCCCLCGERIFFPNNPFGTNIMPPIIFFSDDGYYVCEKCYKEDNEKDKEAQED